MKRRKSHVSFNLRQSLYVVHMHWLLLKPLRVKVLPLLPQFDPSSSCRGLGKNVITINIAVFYVWYRKLILTGVQQTARNFKIWRSRMTNKNSLTNVKVEPTIAPELCFIIISQGQVICGIREVPAIVKLLWIKFGCMQSRSICWTRTIFKLSLLETWISNI